MMTPDELRQEADRLARRGDGADAHIVRAAADAWEKDLVRLENNRKVVATLRKKSELERVALRKRLEETEERLSVALDNLMGEDL